MRRLFRAHGRTRLTVAAIGCLVGCVIGSAFAVIEGGEAVDMVGEGLETVEVVAPEPLTRALREPSDQATAETQDPKARSASPLMSAERSDPTEDTTGSDPTVVETTSAPAAPVTTIAPSDLTPATSPPPMTPATSPPPTNSPAPPQTTAAVPTTTMPRQPVGSAFTTNTFTEWPIRNTSLDSRVQFVNTPARQLPWQSFTESSDRTIGLGALTANKHLGQFRTQCSFSHFNYDDPLVHPGSPGAAHLHMYFGNTQANANSTYRSLRDSGSSSCNGFEGNRSAYWIPAVFDSSGNARIPSRIELYYKSHDGSFDVVQKPPEGLGMVAGRAADNPHIEWGCQETGAQGTNLNRPVQQKQNTIPSCSTTATLLAHIRFPQCVMSTITETTGNGTAQMRYPTRGYYTNSCPAGATLITSIEFFIAWNPDNHDGRTQDWWISSDVQMDGTRAANGSTLHGDWLGAWNPELMDEVHRQCVARLAECGWDLVGDNRRITWIEHFGSKNPAAYSGPRSIPAELISRQLCPGDPYSRPEDVAGCGH